MKHAMEMEKVLYNKTVTWSFFPSFALHRHTHAWCFLNSYYMGGQEVECQKVLLISRG